MMHPDTTVRWIDDDVGLGVVATATIPVGSLVWVRDTLDRVVSTHQFDSLPPLQRAALRRHVWQEGGRWYLTWDHGRYTNHCCEPNCAGLDGEFDLAIRDIEAGDQITNDYGWLAMEVSFACRCGARDCRGWIGEDSSSPPDGALVSPYLDALRRLPHTEQPLWPLVADEDGVGFDMLRSRYSEP